LQARGLAGWLVRRGAMRMGGAAGMCLYILVFLLPQPVRSRAILETCVGGHLCAIHDAALLPVTRLAHLEPDFPVETSRSNFEGARPEQR